MSIRIAGVGAYVPERVVSNAELARTVDTSDEWIVAKTGIAARRLCDPGEAPSDMGHRAAVDCLRNAGADSTAVDLIVVACATPDQPQPAVACFIQEKLGISARHVPAFDVNSVCAGFIFALNVAQSMMLSAPAQYRNVLVVGTDAFSRIMNWHDRRTCIFFGDGAGSVLLSQSGPGERRIQFDLGSDGRGAGAIQVQAGGSRMPVTPEVLEKRLHAFTMDGPKVWDFAVDTVPRVVRGLLAQSRLTTSDLDVVILHQSNLRMIETIMSRLDLPMDRAVTTLESYGNTAAASIPLTLRRAWDLGRLRPGARVMLCGFGGGLSWGAALMEW
jgi:3-oxoacyl-[acyl-carrier-protein] synthase-3